MNNRIKLIRKYFNLSQSEFANKIHKSPGFIANVETNRSNISDQTISTIANVFNININWLKDGKGEMFKEGFNISEIDNNNIRLRVKTIRKIAGLTQKEFADKIGYSKMQIYFVENGKVSPSNVFLNKLADTFGINHDWLLRGTGDIKNNKVVLDDKLIEWLNKNPEVIKELKERSNIS